MHVWGCGQCACVILHTSGFSYSGRGGGRGEGCDWMIGESKRMTKT